MTIQLRRDTAANWTSVNPVLANGQPGYDTTNKVLKIGDGTTAWASLTAIGGFTDHGALTGLADDDHTQYHNDTRGDARYYTKSQADTLLDGKFDTPSGDSTQYLDGSGNPVAFPVAGQAGTLVRQVRNTTGSTITKGTVVYISGASGNKPTVSKAIATSDTTSAQTFGLIQADIANNQNGYAVVRGDLIGIDTSALTDGAQLYLSPATAGAYTTTKPVAPYHMVYVGIVSRSHSTQGQIEVAVQNGYELDEIHDCLIVSKTNKDVLSYDSASGLWINKQLAPSDITGLGTLATQSGTFSGTSSGTNTGDQNLFNTIAVSGQSNVVADSATDTLTLVAGTNVTITTDAGTDTITINASGGGIVRSVLVTAGNTSLGGSALTDYVCIINGNHLVTLPTAIGNTNRYTIQNSYNAVATINTSLSQTINLSASISIAPNTSRDLISDGANWRVI